MKHKSIRVGINVSSVVSCHGKTKEQDGIGRYTSDLIEALEPMVDLKKIYFKSTREVSSPVGIKISKNIDYVAANQIINQYSPYHHYQKLENGIDLLHSTNYLPPKLKKTPVVATICDAMLLQQPYYSHTKLRRLKNYLIKQLVRNANHVITISHAMKKDMIEYWRFPEEIVSVVYPAIRSFWFNKLSHDHIRRVLHRYGIHKKFMLMVGTIQPKKNYARVTQAYQQLSSDKRSEVMLVIAGKRGWSCEHEIEQFKEMESQGQLKWFQYVPIEDLQPLYQASLALLFPSLNEGFGLPILEGFASNTPVLTSTIAATTEVADGAAYLVDPKSMTAIKEGMQALIESQSLRHQLISRGRVRLDEFSWEKSAEEIVGIYHKVLRDYH